MLLNSVTASKLRPGSVNCRLSLLLAVRSGTQCALLLQDLLFCVFRDAAWL